MRGDESLECLEDYALLGRVLRGDRRAFVVFIRRFRRLIGACAVRAAAQAGVRLQDADVADVVADTVLHMLEDDHRRLRLYRLEGGASVSSWVAIIAATAARGHVRRHRRRAATALRRSLLAELAPPVELPDERALDRERRALLDQALSSLSLRDRQLLELYCVRAMSAEAIARAMGVSVSTVYSKKAKIKARLAGVLGAGPPRGRRAA